MLSTRQNATLFPCGDALGCGALGCGATLGGGALDGDTLGNGALGCGVLGFGGALGGDAAGCCVLGFGGALGCDTIGDGALDGGVLGCGLLGDGVLDGRVLDAGAIGGCIPITTAKFWYSGLSCLNLRHNCVMIICWHISSTAITMIAKGAIWTLTLKALGTKISAAIAKSVIRGQANVARNWAL